MISVIPARRRAEEFAALLEGRAGASDARFSDLLELVGDLRELPRAAPRPEFVTELRSQLMAAADEALSPLDSRLSLRTPAATPTRRRDRRLAVAAGAIVAIGATSSVAVAAQNALPGDVLYPVKRALESAQTSVQADDEARAEHILQSASGRLEEARALAMRDTAESKAAMPGTLDDFVTQSNQAADLLIQTYDQSGETDHILELRGFTAQSLDLLAGLKPELPAELADELQAAVDALLAIDGRALDACPDCGGLLELPLALVSGGSVADPGLAPTIAPRSTLEAPGLPTATTTTDAVQDLLAQLPLLGQAATQQPPTGGSTSGGTGSDGADGGGSELPEVDAEEPINKVTDPVLGDEGLLAGDSALANLLAPVVDPLTGEGGLLGR